MCVTAKARLYLEKRVSVTWRVEQRDKYNTTSNHCVVKKSAGSIHVDMYVCMYVYMYKRGDLRYCRAIPIDRKSAI